MPHSLRLGRISYLNVAPLFSAIEDLHHDPALIRTAGHPSRLNADLAEGRVDLAPASAFAYLQGANSLGLTLLPDLSISAAKDVILSVLLMLPFPPSELTKRAPGTVGLSRASASSSALLRVLWQRLWKLPEPEWQTIEPGSGLGLGRPFLEIGDAALRLRVKTPPGWHYIDLGQAWQTLTGLPFVFGGFIVRGGLTADNSPMLVKVYERFRQAADAHPGNLLSVLPSIRLPDWLSPQQARSYLSVVDYSLDARRRASLLLFAQACVEIGLLPEVPSLCFTPGFALKEDEGELPLSPQAAADFEQWGKGLCGT